MTKTFCRRLAVLLTLACAGAIAAEPAAPAASAVPVAQRRVHFDFHSGFLMNLHHFLYDAARHPEHLAQAHWAQPPTPDELAALQAGAEFYRAHYARHSLPFDATLAQIRVALSVADDSREDVGRLTLLDGLATVLQRAAPAYAHCLWPVHDAANRAWIAHVQTLDARYGAEVQQGVEQALQHPFPPGLRDDVVADTGDLNGAYTADSPPQAVFPSERADYGGWAALEMLYHEASHAGVTDRLSDRIDAQIAQQHRAPDHQLWHAAQFYAVGFVTQRVLHDEAAIDYQPYAQRNDVYGGRWAAYLPLLDGPWRAYLSGHGTMDEAVQTMVAALPAAH
jgi:hypothetical protein